MVAVITGGASGMGRSTAMLFAREGAKVVVGDVDDAEGARLADEAKAAGLSIVFQHTDVSQEDQVAGLIARAEKDHGKLDTIFNNEHAIITAYS